MSSIERLTVEIHDSSRIAGLIEKFAGADADSNGMAAAITAILSRIEAALRPVLGQQGVVALYKRSLKLTTPKHAWLSTLPEGTAGELPMDTLRAAFSEQGRANALIGGSDLIASFEQLLTTLIGPSLTERLLRPAWTPPLSGTSAKDTTP